MDHIVKKARKQLHILRLLKRSNADTKTLTTVYLTVIRPILEYACQVWHYIQHKKILSEDIERIQKRAFITPFQAMEVLLVLLYFANDVKGFATNTSNYDLTLPRKYLFIYLTLPIIYTYIHTRITYNGQMAGNTLQLTPI